MKIINQIDESRSCEYSKEDNCWIYELWSLVEIFGKKIILHSYMCTYDSKLLVHSYELNDSFVKDIRKKLKQV